MKTNRQCQLFTVDRLCGKGYIKRRRILTKLKVKELCALNIPVQKLQCRLQFFCAQEWYEELVQMSLP